MCSCGWWVRYACCFGGVCVRRNSRDEVVDVVVFGGGALGLVDEGRGAGEGIVGFADEV
jgi:hypothetical protein